MKNNTLNTFLLHSNTGDPNAEPDILTRARCVCVPGYFALPMELNGVSIEGMFPHWTLDADEDWEKCHAVPVDATTQVVCQECPSEIDCSRVGNTFENLKVPSGFWQDSKGFQFLIREDAEPLIVSKSNGKKFYVEDCSIATKAEFCLSSDNISNWNLCEEGMEGTFVFFRVSFLECVDDLYTPKKTSLSAGAMCGMCIQSDKYNSPLYHRGVDGKCARCKDNGANLIYFSIFLAALLIVSTVLFFKWQEILSYLFQSVDAVKSKSAKVVPTMQSKETEEEKKTEEDKKTRLVFKTNTESQGGSSSFRVKIKIMVSLYQIILSFVSTFHLDWPITFYSMVNIIGTLVFERARISSLYSGIKREVSEYQSYPFTHVTRR